MRFGHFTSKFKRCDRLLSADRRETLQKFVERIAGFKMVVEGLHRNSRSHEDWCAAEDLRIAVDDRGRVGHGLCPILRVYARPLLLCG